MARSFQLIDDLDGTPAQDTVRFSYRGERYEIDLSPANIVALDEVLAPYIEHARTVGHHKKNGDRNDAIREWARGQGITVSDRGRISNEVVSAYEQRSA